MSALSNLLLCATVAIPAATTYWAFHVSAPSGSVRSKVLFGCGVILAAITAFSSGVLSDHDQDRFELRISAATDLLNKSLADGQRKMDAVLATRSGTKQVLSTDRKYPVAKRQAHSGAKPTTPATTVGDSGNMTLDEWLRQPQTRSDAKPTTEMAPVEGNGVTTLGEFNRQHQVATIQQLTSLYILSHDDVSAEMLAGLQLPPADWMNQQLAQRNEIWRLKNIRGTDYQVYTILDISAPPDNFGNDLSPCCTTVRKGTSPAIAN